MPVLRVGNASIEECKLVIFDKDGTLVDQHPLLLQLARARRNCIREHGGEEIANLWEKIVGVNLKTGKIDYNGPLGSIPRSEELLVASAAFYLSDFSWDDATRTTRKAYDEADRSLKPPFGSVLLEGATETLNQLRQHGLKLAVATTDTHERTVKSLEALRIDSFFDVIIGGDDVRRVKPAADMVVSILEKTGCKSRDTVMVADSISDMQMGKNAQVKMCVGVLTGSASREKLLKVAEIVIPSVRSLRAV